MGILFGVPINFVFMPMCLFGLFTYVGQYSSIYVKYMSVNGI